MRFSERYGYVPIRTTVQVESMDDPLRAGLWNIVAEVILDPLAKNERPGWNMEQNTALHNLCFGLWVHFYRRPVDTMPTSWSEVRAEIRSDFFACDWHQVYDYVEYLVSILGADRKESVSDLFNGILKREVSAYRLAADRIVRIVDDVSLDAIDKAANTELDAPRAHIRSAIAMVSDRQSPDYRNSIKESISAVEASARILLNDDSCTLGKALPRIQDKFDLHPAMARGLSALYGYTSDQHGIRHSLVDSDSTSLEDALFLLSVASASVTFLEALQRQ